MEFGIEPQICKPKMLCLRINPYMPMIWGRTIITFLEWEVQSLKQIRYLLKGQFKHNIMLLAMESIKPTKIKNGRKNLFQPNYFHAQQDHQFHPTFCWNLLDSISFWVLSWCLKKHIRYIRWGSVSVDLFQLHVPYHHSYHS